MHRCWLGEIAPLTVGEMVALSPQESAHVARVLRMQPGDAVQLLAAEKLYTGELSAVDAAQTMVRVLEELPSPEASIRITLVQGLAKADKLEWIIQKATELGVWDVMPVEMERSMTRLDGKEAKKHERWNRIALEAAKQSGRAHVPQVRLSCRWKDALKALESAEYDAVFIAWEEEGENRLSEAVRKMLIQKPETGAIALVIGPEGGITPTEVERLQAFGGQCVTLGKRILRTETAGLCALAVTMSALGEM